MYEYRCDERRRDTDEGSTFLTSTYTELCLDVEHLKIETRLIDERFASGGLGVTNSLRGKS
jgi:hypothetical protein